MLSFFTKKNPLPDTIAAIDLGSNSFHMLVARHEDDHLIVIDQHREMVRLAAGLNEHNQISPEVAQRALDCLSRFGERIKDVPAEGVRIVGTNTLRKAGNSGDFIQQAEARLGHPIEIISGIEEARLIYLGVAHGISLHSGQRLVIDIGGGSTECIIGEQFRPLHMQSLYMGCVSFSQRFFPDGVISKPAINQAYINAMMELEPHINHYKDLGWQDAIGASGTIKAINKIVQAMGLHDQGISTEALQILVDRLSEVEHIDDLKLAGMKEERRAVFPGGLMVLKALFDGLDIKLMYVSNDALREGLLYDLLNREQQEDTRSTSIQAICKRYHVDLQHAEQVEGTAAELFNQLAGNCILHPAYDWQPLSWAAYCHEIGMNIAFSQYHKHGEYILRYADLLGFSNTDQQVLAALVRCHRRSINLSLLNNLPSHWQQKSKCLMIILRLAVVLNRSRKPVDVIPKMEANEDTIYCYFPDNYFQQHPLTYHDLLQEQKHLQAAGINLQLIQKNLTPGQKQASANERK